MRTGSTIALTVCLLLAAPLGHAQRGLLLAGGFRQAASARLGDV